MLFLLSQRLFDAILLSVRDRQRSLEDAAAFLFLECSGFANPSRLYTVAIAV